MRLLLNIPLFSALFFINAEALHAQIKKPGITLGANIIYTKPKENFDKTYNFGGGAEIYGGAGFGKTYIIATAGLSEFKAQSGSHAGTLKYIPVKIGVRQFIFRKILFVNADLGRATVKNRNFNTSQFTRGIGVGAKLLGVQAGLYYDGWKNVHARGFANSVNFKIGWSLSL